MNKYYIAHGTIDGEQRRIEYQLVNFRGTLEQAAEIFARTNPGVEDAELKENGDSERGHIEAPRPPDVSRDFAKAMMKPPRTVKVAKPRGIISADAQGRPFDPKAGVPVEVVPAAEIAKAK